MRLRETARFASFVVGEQCAGVRRVAGLAAGGAARRLAVGPRRHRQIAPAAGRVRCGGERGEAAAYIDLALAPSSAMLEGCDTLGLVCLDGLEAVAADAGLERGDLSPAHAAAGRHRPARRCEQCAAREPCPSRCPTCAHACWPPTCISSPNSTRPGSARHCGCAQPVRGLDLSEEAALYLVHRLPRDMHSLFGVLDQLDEASLAAQRRLTVPFLRTRWRGHGRTVLRAGVTQRDSEGALPRSASARVACARSGACHRAWKGRHALCLTGTGIERSGSVASWQSQASDPGPFPERVSAFRTAAESGPGSARAERRVAPARCSTRGAELEPARLTLSAR